MSGLKKKYFVGFFLLEILAPGLDLFKDYRIEGGGDRFSVHFAVTYLDRRRTSFCV